MDDGTPKPKKSTGPKPERLKLRGDWQGLIGKALAKKRPAKGWPKQKKGKR
jgi:hypothetical protein